MEDSLTLNTCEEGLVVICRLYKLIPKRKYEDLPNQMT